MDEYNINVNELLPSKQLKGNMFQVMQAIKNQYAKDPNVKLNELNNILIQEVRDDILANNRKILQRNKPNVKTLDRDKAIYGDRPVMEVQIKPRNTFTTDKAEVDKRFEDLMNERNLEYSKPVAPDTSPIGQVLKDDALNADDFNARLNNLEKSRNDYMDSYLKNSASIRDEASTKVLDPKTFFEEIQKPKEFVQELKKTPVPKVLNKLSTSKQADLIKAPVSNILKNNYLLLHGYDRNWATYPMRFKFSVDVHSMQKQYRNIREIAVTRLIIPMEIVKREQNAVLLKNTFVNQFGMAFPYVTVAIDELGDIYDSVSEACRKSFATFIYDTEYVSPNGRGYLILQPMQNERKVFFPNNLSALQRMSISINRPNGSLYNNSMDDYMVLKVEYEAYNSLYLKIVTNKYFDKNEFYVGDTVYIQNYQMPPWTSTSSPEYTEYIANREAYDLINSFMNRLEGHEIIQLGDPNENGFYRNFYIYAPGYLDQSIGKIIVNSTIVNQIVSYNNNNSLACVANPTSCGNIINTSLQCILSMQVVTSIGNAGYAIESENI